MINYYTSPSGAGYEFTYIIPIEVQGYSVSAIFGSNFAPDFKQVAPDEWQFAGKFVYAPSAKGFRFYSDAPPAMGIVTLRADKDYPFEAAVPVPEPGILTLIPFIWAIFKR